MFRFRALAAGACTALAAFVALPVTTAVAAPPAPCNNAPQITDAKGDGHHRADERAGAWWSEANGRLQAAIKVCAGAPVAEHDEARDRRPGTRWCTSSAVETRYVRASAAARRHPVYDYGTYAAGGFAALGPTTGVVEPAANGTVTIDVPAVAAGTLLARPFVVTCDGINGACPTVDHAPGGVHRPTRPSARTTSSAPATPRRRPARRSRRPPCSSRRPRA